MFQPFFLYYAPNAVRAGPNKQNPLQAPPDKLSSPDIRDISDMSRRKYAGKEDKKNNVGLT